MNISWIIANNKNRVGDQTTSQHVQRLNRKMLKQNFDVIVEGWPESTGLRSL